MISNGPHRILSVKEYIPHRGRMLLVDHIVDVDESTATTKSKVGKSWPSVVGGYADSVILLELLAQTAGVCIGRREHLKSDGQLSGQGWLVGIKRATFAIDQLSIGDEVIATTKNRFTIDGYTEIIGVSKIGNRVIVEAVLQVLHQKESLQLSSA